MCTGSTGGLWTWFYENRSRRLPDDVTELCITSSPRSVTVSSPCRGLRRRLFFNSDDARPSRQRVCEQVCQDLRIDIVGGKLQQSRLNKSSLDQFRNIGSTVAKVSDA